MNLSNSVKTKPLIQDIDFDDLKWLVTLFEYDLSLARHSFEVARLTAHFTRHLGLPERQKRLLYRAALLHDVGKLSVPLEVLHKPGGLDERQRCLMHLHPSVGAELLVNSGETDPALLQIVRAHHERINGAGYPFGLAGPQLNMDVRIVSLCDVLVACTEVRPYIQALSVDEGCDLVLQERLGLDHGVAVQLVDMVEQESLTSLRTSEDRIRSLKCCFDSSAECA